MSFETHETNGYGHGLNLVFISHWLRGSHPMRDGCRERKKRYSNNACLPYVALLWALITPHPIMAL